MQTIETFKHFPAKVVYLAVIILVAVGFSWYIHHKSLAAQTHYLQGNQFLKQGKLGEAAQEYEKAIRLKPGHLDAQNNLANLLATHGKVEEAIKHYQKAIQINPKYLEAQNNLGLALASAQKFDEATKHYTKALKLLPKAPELHNSFGTVLAQQGKLEEAATQFSEAIKLHPDYQKAKQNLELIQKQKTDSLK